MCRGSLDTVLYKSERKTKTRYKRTVKVKRVPSKKLKPIHCSRVSGHLASLADSQETCILLGKQRPRLHECAGITRQVCRMNCTLPSTAHKAFRGERGPFRCAKVWFQNPLLQTWHLKENPCYKKLAFQIPREIARDAQYQMVSP